ncbi:MAG: acyltransferase [Marinobacter sp.]|uniref:acyltransferase family protein n=1 Tax=Marinobacter sp. TaxID=50741 RepID=UPI0029C315BA|nr:acyltransferase family protein [Marinobacter sp.]MDX5386345.1 acyltransferase [Marinobacter sp.]MDX5471829.1 acyltransferase [Marinobacter sp.]
MSVISYRPDIDGLRAVAVLAVVLFHAGFEEFSGGFVGVDVFFVISGYLIGSIVLKELESGSFTFRGFYERRVRRILPALFVVLIVTAVAGYFLLLPDEFVALGQASLATLFFGSNIYFWDKKSTYFGLDINTEPLLHTWSLGVEEQFYLFFPLLLWTLYKRGLSRNQLFAVFTLLFAASLALNLVATPFYTKFSFYMIPARAWELLLGVMLALGVLPEVRRAGLAAVLAMAGLVLVLGTVLLLEEGALFPGVNAIYPVVGTALIIYAGRKHTTFVHRVLANKFVVYLGLISYSLYLWHWPVTIYTGMLWDSPYAKLFIVVVSIVLAAISYRFIENRYRGSGAVVYVGGVKKRRGVGEIGVTALAVFMVAWALVISDGAPGRVPDKVYEVVGVDRVSVDTMKDSENCRLFSENPDGRGEKKGYLCLLGDPSGVPEFIVWGDSHARALIPAFQAAAERSGITGIALTNSGCQPLAGVYREAKYRCLNFNTSVLEFIEARPDLKQIFLVGYWRVPLMGKSYDNNNFLIKDEKTSLISPEENRRVFQRGLERTVAQLDGREVFLVEDVPEVGAKYGKALANHFVRSVWLTGEGVDALYYEDVRDEYIVAFEAVLDSLNGEYQWFPVKHRLCDEGLCPLVGDARLLYKDGDHLSQHGAMLLLDDFQTVLSHSGAR